MNTDIKIFYFKDNNGRIILNEKQEPEFCAKDVTEILGYSNGKDAIIRHCKSRGVVKHDLPSASGNQVYTFRVEGNLYKLIMKSDKPEAEPFEDWICDKVMPSIRKIVFGLYMKKVMIEN